MLTVPSMSLLHELDSDSISSNDQDLSTVSIFTENELAMKELVLKQKQLQEKLISSS